MVRFTPAAALLQNAGMGTEAGQRNERVASDLFVTVRLRFGLSQNKLAERLGISLRHLQYVESGDSQPTAPVFLKCLAMIGPDLVRQIEQSSRAAVVPVNAPATVEPRAIPQLGLGVSPA